MSERKDSKLSFQSNLVNDISLGVEEKHHCANSENKASLVILFHLDKLKKISFRIRKTNG